MNKKNIFLLSSVLFLFACSSYKDIQLSCDCLYRTIGSDLERYACSLNRDFKRALKVNSFFETFSDSGFEIEPIEFTENYIRYKQNEYYYLLNRITLRYIYSVNNDDHYYQCKIVKGI